MSTTSLRAVHPDTFRTRRQDKAPVALGTPCGPKRAMPPKEGGLRTWWDIAVILHEELGQPMMCGQTVRNIHDKALEKIKKALLADDEQVPGRAAHDIHAPEPEPADGELVLAGVGEEEDVEW